MRAPFWTKSHLINGKKSPNGEMAKMRAPFWIKITLDYWQKVEKSSFLYTCFETKINFGKKSRKMLDFVVVF